LARLASSPRGHVPTFRTSWDIPRARLARRRSESQKVGSGPCSETSLARALPWLLVVAFGGE
jgi:hypothetical protein